MTIAVCRRRVLHGGLAAHARVVDLAHGGGDGAWGSVRCPTHRVGVRRVDLAARRCVQVGPRPGRARRSAGLALTLGRNVHGPHCAGPHAIRLTQSLSGSATLPTTRSSLRNPAKPVERKTGEIRSPRPTSAICRHAGAGTVSTHPSPDAGALRVGRLVRVASSRRPDRLMYVAGRTGAGAHGCRRDPDPVGAGSPVNERPARSSPTR